MACNDNKTEGGERVDRKRNAICPGNDKRIITQQRRSGAPHVETLSKR